MPTVLKTPPKTPKDGICWQQRGLVPDSCCSSMDSPSCVQTPSGLGPPVVTLTASVTLWHHQWAERGFRGQAQKWHTSRHPHSTGQSSGMGTPLPARGAGEQAAVSPGVPTHRLCHKSPSPVVTASLKLLLIPQKSQGSGPPLPRGASSQSEKSTEGPPLIPTGRRAPSHSFPGSWRLRCQFPPRAAVLPSTTARLGGRSIW